VDPKWFVFFRSWFSATFGSNANAMPYLAARIPIILRCVGSVHGNMMLKVDLLSYIYIYIVIIHNMSHTHIYKSCQTSQISSKWCSVQNIMFTGRPVTSRGKRTHPIGCSVDHIQIVKLQTSQKLETSANLIHRLLAMCGYCLLSLLANVH
jgi:hypothetical protein